MKIRAIFLYIMMTSQKNSRCLYPLKRKPNFSLVEIESNVFLSLNIKRNAKKGIPSAQAIIDGTAIDSDQNLCSPW